MGNSYYDIECTDEELGIFTVRKRKAPGTVYYLTLKEDGTWMHTCKAITVYGEDYECRHKKMVLQEFFVNEKFKSVYNISPKRNKK
jgi:hypothetical protein